MIAFIPLESKTGAQWMEERRETGIVADVFFRKKADGYETRELIPAAHAALAQAKQKAAVATDVQFREGAVSCGTALSSAA